MVAYVAISIDSSLFTSRGIERAFPRINSATVLEVVHSLFRMTLTAKVYILNQIVLNAPATQASNMVY